MKRSAQKRDRQSKERRMRNRQTKSTFRTAIKKFDAACTAGNKEEALAFARRMAEAVLLHLRGGYSYPSGLCAAF